LRTGHDHNYEQFARQDAEGNPAADGIRSFVIGTGGTLLTKVDYDKRARNSETIYGGSIGILKVVLFENRYEWSFLPATDVPKPSLAESKDECTDRELP
jgi:hypothetical protein